MDFPAEREMVLPGTQVGENAIFDNTCYNEEGKVIAAVKGLYRSGNRGLRIIPAKGVYVPKAGDLVIGVISLVHDTFWLADIGGPYKSFILKDEVIKSKVKENLRKYYDVGDLVSGKVEGTNEVHSHILIRPWKLEKSLIIKVNPKRIPRVIGKNRSMLEIIKQKTGSRIIVGQNGLIWLKDGNIDLAVKAIKKIEAEAQSRGLTNRITEYLDSKGEEK